MDLKTQEILNVIKALSMQYELYMKRLQDKIRAVEAVPAKNKK